MALFGLKLWSKCKLLHTFQRLKVTALSIIYSFLISGLTPTLIHFCNLFLNPHFIHFKSVSVFKNQNRKQKFDPTYSICFPLKHLFIQDLLNLKSAYFFNYTSLKTDHNTHINSACICELPISQVNGIISWLQDNRSHFS